MLLIGVTYRSLPHLQYRHNRAIGRTGLLKIADTLGLDCKRLLVNGMQRKRPGIGARDTILGTRVSQPRKRRLIKLTFDSVLFTSDDTS